MGHSASAEPEVLATDGAELVNPDNGEVSEPGEVSDPPATEDGVADVEKGDGDAPEVVQSAKKPAEGEAVPHLLVH